MIKDISALFFGRDETMILKGIAIIMMMILHVLWFITEFESPSSTYLSVVVPLQRVCKLCVAIFTFLVGWGYAFAQKRDAAYSFKRISRLLRIYWSI